MIISRDVLFFEDSKIQSPSFQNYIVLPVLLRDRNNAKTGAREDVNDDSNTDESQTSSINNNLTFGTPSSSGITNSTLVNNVLPTTPIIQNLSSDNDVADTFDDAENTFEDTIVSQIDDTKADPHYAPSQAINVDPADRPATRGLTQTLNPFNFALQTVTEALASDESSFWKDAMKEELDSHMTNHTWDLAELPPGKKPIKSKWVFKKKTNANGEVIRYKARLVVKGCSQREGIDFDGIYSPVVRYVSIRYLISIAAQFDLDVFQLDAITAFLQGELEETIYMQQPEACDDGSNKVCVLRKSIYGLKQASRVLDILILIGARIWMTDDLFRDSSSFALVERLPGLVGANQQSRFLRQRPNIWLYHHAFKRVSG